MAVTDLNRQFHLGQAHASSQKTQQVTKGREFIQGTRRNRSSHVASITYSIQNQVYGNKLVNFGTKRRSRHTTGCYSGSTKDRRTNGQGEHLHPREQISTGQRRTRCLQIVCSIS